MFAIDIIRPDHGPNGNHGGAPAIQAPATPSPVTTDGIVLEYTVPVADLPTTDWMRTVLDHLSIPPGTTTGGSSNCCSGPMIESPNGKEVERGHGTQRHGERSG